MDRGVKALEAKADPADVAKAGWEAMLAGRAGVTPGLRNKVIATLAGVLPDTLVARIHRVMAEPEDEGEGRASPKASD